MKVSKQTIDELLEQVTYQYITVSDSHIICIAFLNGFKLSQGESKTIDPLEFDLELGKKYSYESAKALAEEKLWELEGYVLHKSLYHNFI